jgi:hypothetical protein
MGSFEVDIREPDPIVMAGAGWARGVAGGAACRRVIQGALAL